MLGVVVVAKKLEIASTRYAQPGYPKCTKCSSDKFKSVHVSASFLEKLKNKPKVGGRFPYRKTKPTPSDADLNLPSDDGESKVTLEDLFQLNKEQIQHLFEQSFDYKLDVSSYEDRPKSETRDREVRQFENLRGDSKCLLRRTSRASLKKNASSASLSSKKPLNCPHDPCKKIIAISSFYSHFQYDHPEISRHSLERGKQLSIPFVMAVLEHNKTTCLGLITVYDKFKKKPVAPFNTSLSSHNHKIPVNTFWIMLSGSPEEMEGSAYLLIWLFTNNDDYYNCTIELAAENDHVSYSTFCGVNDMHDSQNIPEIAQRLNCLYLSYGSARNVLQYGLDTRLRIMIH